MHLTQQLSSNRDAFLLLVVCFVMACAQQPSSTPPEPTINDAPSTQGEITGTGPDSTGTVEESVSRSQIAERLHHGIDVSMHSGVVDWQTLVDDGHSFAFAKATEGIDLRDPAFAAHWQAMKEAGVIRGAYHFYVTEDDPETQARFFIDTVELEPGDLAPVVDIELIGHGTRPGLPERFAIWLELVERHYGIKPIIYTAPNFWDAHFTDTFGEYPLWVAEYGVEVPRLPKGWKDWHLWQWRANAQVDGVEKDVDLSRLNRSQNHLIDVSNLVVPHADP